MARAQLRGASALGKFYFRKNVHTQGNSGPSSGSTSPVNGNGSHPVKEKKLRNCFPAPPRPENGINHEPVESEYEEMSMKEIMTGKVLLSNVAMTVNQLLISCSQGPNFPGLLGLVSEYLDTLDIPADELRKINAYLDFIRLRSTGQ